MSMNPLRALRTLLNGSRIANTTTRRPCRPTVEQLDARIVPAANLYSAGATAGYPFTAVCEVQAHFPSGVTESGSGAMVDSFHCLTAAHMLYRAEYGGWATSVRVIPEYANGTGRFGTAWATYERVDGSWPSYEQSHPNSISSTVHDIGLLTLNTNIGNQTGWFGFGYNTDNSWFNARYFETAGYPSGLGYNGQGMYYCYGEVNGVTNYDISFSEGNLSDIPGQSGSPLWYTGNHVIYGVLSGATGFSNYDTGFAAEITPSVFNWLQSARMSDSAPSMAPSLAATLPGTTTLHHAVMGTTSTMTPTVMATGHITGVEDSTDNHGRAASTKSGFAALQTAAAINMQDHSAALAASTDLIDRLDVALASLSQPPQQHEGASGLTPHALLSLKAHINTTPADVLSHSGTDAMADSEAAGLWK
jgi:V8-like Glu-specific endopeptidase